MQSKRLNNQSAPDPAGLSKATRPEVASQFRGFIAIELPAEVKAVLKNQQLQLQKAGIQAVKWVAPLNIHLTIKFLGNIRPSQIEPISQAMQSAAAGVHPFQLGIQSAGAFPNLNRAQVIWIGLKGDLEILVNLQKYLDSNLQKMGFTPENRPFSPHLTLGRVRETATLPDKQNIRKLIPALKTEHVPEFSVRAINLMQSRLFPSGAVYNCMRSIEIC